MHRAAGIRAASPGQQETFYTSKIKKIKKEQQRCKGETDFWEKTQHQ